MAAYPGRTDLAIPKVAPGQPYGQAAQQQAALHAVPAAPTPQAIPLTAPTQLPNEPVTAGAPIGAGPGPEVLPQSVAPPNQDPVRQQIAALYRVSPNPDLQRLMELLDLQGR